MNEVSKFTNKGGGRMKAGDILFLMKLMDGEIKKKDLPANSMKKVLYEKCIEKPDTKVLLKVIDKLYANMQSVDMTTGGEPFQIQIKT